MLSFMKSLSTAASGMKVQEERLRVVSENVANADTPGYRRKLMTFMESYDRDTGGSIVQVGDLRLDRSPLDRVFDPSHPMTDETGHVDMSNVDVLVEIADAREAQRTFEANLNMFDQARRMYDGMLDLLRR